MSRRRKKEQREPENLIANGAMLAVIGGFFWVFHLTNSIAVSGIVAGLILALIVGIRIALHMQRIERLKRSGIAEIDKMDGIQFEQYLSHVLKVQGYHVEVTRAAKDFGADLVISKAGRKIVVQAKRHSKTVGLKAVQEVQASIAHYGAAEGWVIANRDFTDEAYTLAKSNQIRLINREALIEMILKLNPGAAGSVPIAKAARLSPGERVCKRCNSKMVLRNGKQGAFMGCSSYPKCRHVESV